MSMSMMGRYVYMYQVNYSVRAGIAKVAIMVGAENECQLTGMEECSFRMIYVISRCGCNGGDWYGLLWYFMHCIGIFLRWCPE